MDAKAKLKTRKIKKYLPLFLFGILAISFGLVFAVAGWGGHLKSKKVLKKGGRTKALITTKDKDHLRSTTEYMIYYKYTDNKDRVFEGKTRIPGQDWVELKIGDQIEIAYDLDNPEWDVLVGYDALHMTATPILASVVGLIAVIVGTGLIIVFFKSLKTKSVLKNL